MTIAISVKVHDGIVLAADSASTIMSSSADGEDAVVFNVYNNANKIFNLFKGLPIGGMTWGAGSIGSASISTLTKDLRKRFASASSDWSINPTAYTIEEVAEKVRKFLYDEKYSANKEELGKMSMGFLVAGYSANSDQSEEWLIEIEEGMCKPIEKQFDEEETGSVWFGEPEAISRLLNGYGSRLPSILTSLGVEPSDLREVMELVQSELAIPLSIPPMPIQDAIDLAEFLVHVTIMYSRFAAGPPSVGGPIESAAITRHEGFKWVKRKHYFSSDLNVKDGALQ